MKSVSVGLLVIGLAFAGNAAAQAYYGDPQEGHYDNGYPAQAGPAYDYARVLRVDPVIESGYGNGASPNPTQCYYRDADDVYVGNDDYYQGDRDYHRDDGYHDRNDAYRSGGTDSGRTVATVLGGIAGAVLGSKVGEGSGRYVGTAVGSMVGGMAGRSIYETSQRNRQAQRRGSVRVCDPVAANAGRDGRYQDERLSGYDVTYEYANRTYKTRTDHHPGDRIRVRVDVRPD